jgi:hypothetical protein
VPDVEHTDSGRRRLRDAVEALDARVSWTRLSVIEGELAAGDRWVTCAALIADPSLLAGWAEQARAHYGRGTDPLTGAGLVLDWYLAAVALPAVGAFHLGQVLVDLDPAAVALRLGAPSSPASATALLRADPVAAGASAADLTAGLAAQLRGHAEAFLAAFGPQFRFSRRACWAAVTDQVDTAFLTAGWVSGEKDRAAAEAAAVLGADEAGSWLPGAGWSTLHQLVDVHGRSHWTRRRHGCCLLYRVPGVAPCLSCPRVGDEVRRASAARWD